MLLFKKLFCPNGFFRGSTFHYGVGNRNMMGFNPNTLLLTRIKSTFLTADFSLRPFHPFPAKTISNLQNISGNLISKSLNFKSTFSNFFSKPLFFASAPVLASESPLELSSKIPSFDEPTLLVRQLLEEYSGPSFYFQTIARLAQIFFLFQPVIFQSFSLFLGEPSPIWWSSVRYFVELAGPCCMKWAQWATTRPDLFSPRVLSFLSKFQDQCPTHPWEDTEAILRKELGPLEDHFLQFEKFPVASGAIAQVYRGVLRDGTRVAVKVRHPMAEASVRRDLAIMNWGAKCLDSIPPLHFLSFREATLQFSQNMLQQLSLAQEARNLLIFRNNFRDDPHLRFPRPILHLCKSNAVLVETWEEGKPISWYFKNGSPRINQRLAQIGLNAFLKMMLLDNFMHADLHPGNILVRENGSQLELIFLDVGLTNRLSDMDIWLFTQLFASVVDGNPEYGAELMVKYAPKGTLISPERQKEFQAAMGLLFRRIQNVRLVEIEVGKFLSEMLDIAREFEVTLEGSFATLVVATIILEGIGRQLDKNINLITSSVPFLAKAVLLRPKDLPPFPTTSLLKRTVKDILK